MSDTISRQALLDKFKPWLEVKGYSEGERNMLKAVLYEIQEFPSKVPERKKGKWIDPAAENCYRCSVCEEYTTLEVPRLFYHYCPNCGAWMKGVKEA